MNALAATSRSVRPAVGSKRSIRRRACGAQDVLQQGGDHAAHEEGHRGRPAQRIHHEHGGGKDRQHHDREAAVVEEEPGDRVQRLHRRATLTPIADAANISAMSATIVASPNAQWMPMPSPNQKSPKADTMMPTPNLRAFSGTRDNGRFRSAAATATATQAPIAPSVAGTSMFPPAPRPRRIRVPPRRSSSRAWHGAD